MKNVVLASLLALAGAASAGNVCFAQLGTGQQGGIQMSADEYKAYNDANTATTPAAKAAGFEAYLKAYPNSAVKAEALQQLLFAYSQSNDTAHTLDAADRLLQVDPNNIRALTFEVYLRKLTADQNTDPAAKTAELDKVAGYAQTGLNAPKPKATADAEWKTLTSQAYPTFQSAIADDDIAKKDYPDAITSIKTEIAAVPDQTQTPGPVLQDVVFLAQSYMNSNPPDYLDCAWYAARAASFAGTFAPQIEPLASYCYKKYHGNGDGYDKLQAAVKTSVNPPADLGTTITPAPKPEDIVANLIATTPDLATLAISDKEFVLQYGKPADADKVFGTVKGKTEEFPDVLVVSATADQVQVAISDDAVQGKKADFAFTMQEPLKTIPAVGSKVTLSGTYDSYTQNPVLITMTGGAVVAKKAPAKTPVHRPVRH